MANAPPLPPDGKAAGVVARSQQPRPKQQPSFEVCKKNALGKLDKSPKGSLDQPIAELVHAINGHPDYVTTSSCSGRVSLFATVSEQSRGYRGGHWLLVKHATVSVDELVEALAAPAAEPAELVLFKHEPAILHLQCRDLEAAKRLLQVALGAGFRESGLVLSQSEKVMLAVRTTSNSLELPVAAAGELVLPAPYLHLLVAQANERFAANRARTEALHAAFLAACCGSSGSGGGADGMAVACAECAEEDAESPPSRSQGPKGIKGLSEAERYAVERQAAVLQAQQGPAKGPHKQERRRRQGAAEGGAAAPAAPAAAARGPAGQGPARALRARGHALVVRCLAAATVVLAVRTVLGARRQR